MRLIDPTSLVSHQLPVLQTVGGAKLLISCTSAPLSHRYRIGCTRFNKTTVWSSSSPCTTQYNVAKMARLAFIRLYFAPRARKGRGINNMIPGLESGTPLGKGANNGLLRAHPISLIPVICGKPGGDHAGHVKWVTHAIIAPRT